MTCCPPYNTSFSNLAFLSIPYGDAARAKWGIAPSIKVFIFDDIEDVYVDLPFFSARIIGDSVLVDFGGISTGYVKLS